MHLQFLSSVTGVTSLPGNISAVVVGTACKSLAEEDV